LHRGGIALPGLKPGPTVLMLPSAAGAGRPGPERWPHDDNEMRNPIPPALLAAARGERVTGAVDAATITAAAKERMSGLLAHAIDDPPRELLLHAVAIDARASSMVAELTRIVEAFRLANVPLLALKGPVASQQLYGHPGLRVFGDLDLLVDAANIEQAHALLTRLGYRDEAPMTPSQRATKHRFHNGTPLVNDERRTTVDLHWRLGHVQFPLALPVTDAWSRRTELVLNGVPVSALGPTDLVIFTCSHAAKHLWWSLESLAQIAALTRLVNVDWEEVDRVATASRAARQVGLSFLLAHDVVGSELPPLPQCLALSQKQFSRMQERLAKTVERDAGGRDLLFLLDRKRDALAAALAAAFVPTHADWEAVKLPGLLYWIARPLRLVAKRLNPRR
jgi:Uncharacterised nucleotidyltransferase